MSRLIQQSRLQAGWHAASALAACGWWAKAHPFKKWIRGAGGVVILLIEHVGDHSRE